MNKIINARLADLLNIVKRQIEADQNLHYVGAGVFITGGCGQMRGLEHLASDIFGMPVTVAHALPMAGVTSAFENPQYTTALGLVKYAHLVQTDRPVAGGLIKNAFQRIRGIFRN